MFPQGIVEYYHLKQVVLWKAWYKEQGNDVEDHVFLPVTHWSECGVDYIEVHIKVCHPRCVDIRHNVVIWTVNEYSSMWYDITNVLNSQLSLATNVIILTNNYMFRPPGPSSGCVRILKIRLYIGVRDLVPQCIA
jgi:hypothetical protein